MHRKNILIASLVLILSFAIGMSLTLNTIAQTDVGQETIDASVRELFTATAIVKQQIPVTQTIQAAFDQAVTATTIANAESGKVAAEKIELLKTFGKGIATGFTYSPTGDHFAINTSIGIWVYDRNDLDATPRLFDNQGESVWATNVIFSLDGTQIFAGLDDGIVRSWDVATGEQLHIFEGHNDIITSVAFSPDGSQILSGSFDHTVRLWDVATGEQLHIFEGHNDIITSVAFSPDGSQALSGAGDGSMRLWDVATGEQLYQLGDRNKPILFVAFSPDGSQMLFRSNIGLVHLWDTDTGEQLNVFGDEDIPVQTVAFSADGSQIITGSRDGLVRLWDIATGEVVQTFGDADNPIGRGEFSPDGSKIIYVEDGIMSLWDATTGEQPTIFKKDITANIKNIGFSPDGSQILIASDDGAVQMWDTGTGEQLHDFDGYGNRVSNATFSPDGSQILSGFGDFRSDLGNVTLWDVATGEQLRVFEGPWSSVRDLDFSQDGSLVFFNTIRTVQIEDTNTGEQLYSFEPEGGVLSAALSPDGTKMISIANDPILWDVATGEQLRTIEEHFGYIEKAMFSPVNDQYITAATGGNIQLWDTAAGELLCLLLEHEDTIVSIAVSADGNWLVSSSLDETMRLWDLVNCEELRVFEGFEKHSKVAISPDGSQILSTYGAEVFLWDAGTGDLLRTFKAGNGEILAVDFSPDGSQFITASYWGVVRLYGIPD